MKTLQTRCAWFTPLLLLLVLTAGTAWGQQASQRALSYVQNNAQPLGLTAADVNGMLVSDAYSTRHNGVTHVFLQQGYQGIGVYNALINYLLLDDDREAVVANRFIPKLAGKVTGSVSGLDAVAATEAAAQHLGLFINEPLRVLEASSGASQKTLLSRGGMASENIQAALVYQPLENGDVRLAWNVGIYTSDARHFWQVRVDAASGALLDQNDLVVEDYWGAPIIPQGHAGPASAPFAAAVQANAIAPKAGAASSLLNPDAYFIFPQPAESPLHPAGSGTPQSTETDPWTDGGTSPADGASPFGWHDTDGTAGGEFTDTRGNNVDAYQDLNNNGSPSRPRPDGGGSLDFNVAFDFGVDPTVNVNPDASIINLFYWNNIFHDVMYQHGFDEASGNFQVNNYGRGGAGGDDVRAEGQDGGGNCNANMATGGDGSRPRMQMYLCTNATPRRDGDLDHGVVVHEYTHGVSNRLTGGPATAGCLSNAEQAGEGWSDWYAMMVTQQPADFAEQARGMGTYLFGQPPDGPGIRNRPYSTDFAVNEFTYDNIKTVSVPHGVGHVWATMAWDLNWALIGDLFTDSQGASCLGDNGNGGGSGFNADVYIPGDASSAGGNNLALQLITDGMKIQPCSPGFVDARNGVLLADEAMTPGADMDPLTPDGRNAWLIWQTFARRGLGFSALQGSPFNRSDGTQAFDVPPSLPTECPNSGSSMAFDIRTKRLFRSVSGIKKVVVRWDVPDVSTNKIDFYYTQAPTLPAPDGTPEKRTPNDSKVKLKILLPGDGPFNIQACEKNSTTVCSDVEQVDFTGVPIDLNEPDEDDPSDKGGPGKNAGVPEEFAFFGNFPNPFNPTTRIEVDLPERAEVRVAVYDILGRQVMTLPAQTVEAGARRGFEVDASRLASGTYLYRLTATMEDAVHVATGRMVLVK